MSVHTRPSGGWVEPGSAHLASSAARRERAEYLLSVAAGYITIHDVVAAAARHRTLLRITLDQLLRAQPGWGATRTAAVLHRLLDACTIPVTQRSLADADIAWLMDPRAGGARLVAFLDLTVERDGDCPWTGFPYTPAPVSALAGAR